MNWVISVPIPELEGSKQILMGTLKLIIYIIMWLIHIAHLLRQYFRPCRFGSKGGGGKCLYLCINISSVLENIKLLGLYEALF